MGRFKARKDFKVIAVSQISQMLIGKRIRHLILAGSLALAAVALSACYPATVAPLATAPIPAGAPATAAAATVAPATAAPTAAPATAAPTVAAATSAPTAAPGTAAPALKQAAAAGITFAYAPSLAQGTQGTTVPAEAGGSDAPWWAAAPAHPEISLTGYVLPKTLHAPRLAVYPAAEFASLNPEAAKRIDTLRRLLQEKPAAPGSDLPFLPLFNAAQQMHIDVQYVSFQGGQGVRYLTQYAQGLMPINNRELIYTFQGLTADGKYYVSAILPVSHSLLPADVGSMPQSERDAMGADFAKYMGNITRTLGEQGAASFRPALADLDALVKSLVVKP